MKEIVYDYCIVDAQWLLTRNYFAIKSNYDRMPDNASKLISTSVLRSIIKLTEVLRFKKVILLWDSYPYHKHTLLQDYKGSRSFTTWDDVEAEEDPEVKARLEIDAHNLQQRSNAKIFLRDLSSMGLPSFYKKGYEADDLAYIFSNRVLEEGKTAVLVSIDTDWNYWINPNVDWYSPKSGVTNYKDTLESLNYDSSLTLFEYKRHYDAFYGSHNDFSNTVTDEAWNLSFNEFYSKYLNKEYDIFQDKSLFEKQYQSLDILNYPGIDKIHSMVYFMDKSGSLPSRGQWEAFRANNGINITDTEYFKLINNLDPKLFWD